MVFCQECGTEIKDDNAKHCQECGAKIGRGNEVSTKIASPKKENRIDSMWLVVAILIPVLGVLGGLYYAWKGKEGAWAVVGLSIFIWFIFAVIIILKSAI